MDVAYWIVGIALAMVIAVIHSFTKTITDNRAGQDMGKVREQFTIRFSEQQHAPAMLVRSDSDPNRVIRTFGLLTPRPTIFITGGASLMSDEDIQRTRQLIDEGIAAFAEKHRITVLDGGTEAGVMEMIGEARAKHGYKFPLLGIAPLHRVSWPGYAGRNAEASLQDGHSHFVLVEGENWGDESQMIINLTRAIANRSRPTMGILINGGQIAEREVYLATAQGEDRVPLLVVDGSGRTADNISTAFKTQQTENQIIKAIIQGGDIRITALDDGVPALLRELERHFLN